MQSKTLKNQKIEINGKEMTNSTYVRWLCLQEAVDLVSKKMKQYGHRLKNEDSDWIKPLAFQKYITERFSTMEYDLEEIDNNPEIHSFKTTSKNKCTVSINPRSSFKPKELKPTLFYQLTYIQKIENIYKYTFTANNGEKVILNFDNCNEADKFIAKIRNEQIPNYQQTYERLADI